MITSRHTTTDTKPEQLQKLFDSVVEKLNFTSTEETTLLMTSSVKTKISNNKNENNITLVHVNGKKNHY
jgi:hypothetical protein